MSYYDDFLNYAYEWSNGEERYEKYLDNLENLASKRLWKKKNGYIISISDMELTHLENTYRLILNKIEYSMYIPLFKAEINRRWGDS